MHWTLEYVVDNVFKALSGETLGIAEGTCGKYDTALVWRISPHVKDHRTGALVINGLLDFFTFAICAPYRSV